MKKYLLFGLISVLFLVGVGVYQYLHFYDGRLHVVFCDVGQGDGIFIRTPNGKNILVDGGPGDLVLGCLARYMPFWERRVDLMMLTHPHLDHFFGLNYVLDRYTVRYFVSQKLANDTGAWRDFAEKVRAKGVAEKFAYEGDVLRVGGVEMRVEAPNISDLERGSPNGLIGETGELASLLMHWRYGDFDLILTGDSQTAILEKVLEGRDLGGVEVLHVPHHGSKTGLSRGVLGDVAPKLAVISVGAKNRYGHPNKGVLEILQEAGVRVLRTDEHGDVEVVSDGERWWVR